MGGDTGKLKQPPVMRAGRWTVLSWREEETSQGQPKKVDFPAGPERLPVCVLPALIPPSLAPSDRLPLKNAPPPSPVFPLLVQEFVGRLLKNKIKHSYLQTVIRRRSGDACVYTAFTS